MLYGSNEQDILTLSQDVAKISDQHLEIVQYQTYLETECMVWGHSDDTSAVLCPTSVSR